MIFPVKRGLVEEIDLENWSMHSAKEMHDAYRSFAASRQLSTLLGRSASRGNASFCPISVIARASRTVSDEERARDKGPIYLSSHTSSNRQPLKTLLTTKLRPLTRGRQQVAARV
jgi:hypothetical protein